MITAFTENKFTTEQLRALYIAGVVAVGAGFDKPPALSSYSIEGIDASHGFPVKLSHVIGHSGALISRNFDVPSFGDVKVVSLAAPADDQTMVRYDPEALDEMAKRLSALLAKFSWASINYRHAYVEARRLENIAAPLVAYFSLGAELDKNVLVILESLLRANESLLGILRQIGVLKLFLRQKLEVQDSVVKLHRYKALVLLTM